MCGMIVVNECEPRVTVVGTAVRLCRLVSLNNIIVV